MSYRFNPFTGNLDLVEDQGGGSGFTPEDGSKDNPFTTLNVKKVLDSNFHVIKANYENIVTRIQVIDGILIVEGVNTIL
jgi:hypothetical protein